MINEEKKMVAYHESGHLITLYILHPTDDIFKASFIFCGGVIGVVYHQSKTEYHSMGKNTCIANIKAEPAGNESEKIKYGKIYNAVSSDFNNTMCLHIIYCLECRKGRKWINRRLFFSSKRIFIRNNKNKT